MPPVRTLTPLPASQQLLGHRLARRPRCAPGARGRASDCAIFSATALPAITCSSGPPCWPGKTAELIFLACSSRAEDHAAAGAAERLVDRGGDDVGVGHRVGVQAGGDEPGEVGHVDHQVGADRVGDRAEALEVEDARVGAPAGEQQLRLALVGDPLDLVHVDQAVLGADLVRRDVVEAAGDVDLHPVAEVAAVGQRQAHDRVAGLQQRVVDGGVGLRAGVRLDVDVVAAEQLLRAVDRELLDDVDVLAAAVVALAGIALGVLVREDAALALEDRLGHEVLRGDHLQRAPLAIELEVDGLGDLRVDLGERALEVVGLEFGHERHGTNGRGCRTNVSSGAHSAPNDTRAAAAMLAPASRPGAATAHTPVELEAAQVDDGRRRARQLAAVEHEVRALADRSRAPPRAPRVGPAGDVGGALQHRPAHAASAPSGSRQARAGRAVRVRPAGERVAARAGSAAAASPRPAAAAPAARACAAELRQRGERELGVEEHHRARLVRRGGP